MTSCEWKRSVTRSFGCSRTTTHQTHENSSSVPQITESSQVEWRAVVGRRVRDLVGPHGAHDFVLLERARVVLVDHLEASASRVEELGAEFGIVAEGRPLAALALDGELLQALRQALVDGRLPARVRSYASTRRRRRVDGGDCDVRRTA